MLSAGVAIVADEQEFSLAGFTSLLKRKVGFGIVYQARSLEELEKALRHGHVDLAVVSSSLVRPETIRAIRQSFEALRLVVIGDASDRSVILGMLAQGIHGFIPRQLHPNDVTAALKFVSRGHIFVPSSVAECADLAEVPRQPHHTELLSGLTQRQVQILRHIAQGATNKEIARLLSISPATVKVHVNAAFRALGVHNRRSATAALLSERGPDVAPSLSLSAHNFA